MIYWVSLMQGGITYGECPVHRPTGPPHGVPGYDQSHTRRVSAPGLALRDRFPSAYGGVAARWETPDRASVYRVPELSTPDTGRSALVYFPIGGCSPPEWRLSRGCTPPACSRFLFPSAVQSAESVCTRQLLAGAATRGRKTDCLASCIDQTCCTINSILRGTAAR